MSLIVGISGIRGIVGESLTPEVVVKYASAFAEYCGSGRIVLGRDGRITGKLIANVASSTLLSMGSDVVALGVCPTPTIQLAVERSGAAGGIAVTASHNPIEWNGLKFIGTDGLFLDAEENRRLRELASKEKRRYVPWKNIGKHTTDDSFLQRHMDEVLRLPYVDAGRIQARRFKVVVDCINAAGGVIVPEFLRRIGCTVVEMNCDVTGMFSRDPEPVPENLRELRDRVRREHADLGVAVDPDVDRLVLVTEQGDPFGEEYTIAAAVQFVLGRHPRNQNVVVNLSTTRAIDDIAKKFGARVVRTPVGEINVARKMKEIGAVVGGEGSGGVILPAVHHGRDAIVGMGLLLQMAAESGGSLSELRSTLPHYSIVKSKIQIAGGSPDKALRGIVERHAHNGSLNTDDGVKIDFPDSWVHVRTSNTEPIMRIIAEAPSREQAEFLVRKFQKELTEAVR